MNKRMLDSKELGVSLHDAAQLYIHFKYFSEGYGYSEKTKCFFY